MAKDIIADGMKEQNHCDTCLNQHTDKCNHCMVTEYHGQRVSNPTNYEQEPCETSTDEPMTMVYPTIFCDDAISRAEVKRLVDFYKEQYDGIFLLNESIDKLPSVQPSRKGQWIKVTNGRGGHECDLCHEYAPSYQDGDEYLTKYCHNCGADMRGMK